jgi:hypothetical protein
LWRAVKIAMVEEFKKKGALEERSMFPETVLRYP